MNHTVLTKHPIKLLTVKIKSLNYEVHTITIKN